MLGVGMLSLPRARIALLFKQRLQICTWDWYSAEKSATLEESDTERVVCAEAIVSGSSLWCLSFLC